jgi:hypothetical protein
MSLSETQQIFQLLTQIEQILNNVEVKSEKIVTDLPKTKEALTTFRELERLALRWLLLARRFGLPEQVDGATNAFMRLIVVIRMAQMSINMMMLGNPVTFLIGVAGLTMSTMNALTMAEGY